MSEQNIPVLEARNITRRFRHDDGRELTACDNVSLSLYKGRTLGLVGESGCGKSTFMRIAMGLDKPNEGSILFKGRDITKMRSRELRDTRQHIQMVFQDPSSSLSPKMKVRDIICEPLMNYHRIKRSEKKSVAEKLLEAVELPPEFAGRYPDNMSGGQRQRVAIARSIALEPDIIIMDEATCSLDVSVQKSIIGLITKLQREKGIAIGFICHNLPLVQSFAHEIAVMYLGSIVETMSGENIAENSLHPYTKALISAVFDINLQNKKEIEVIKGEPPSPLNIPDGCPFCDRCGHCTEKCRKVKPTLKRISDDHMVACHLYGG